MLGSQKYTLILCDIFWGGKYDPCDPHFTPLYHVNQEL